MSRRKKTQHITGICKQTSTMCALCWALAIADQLRRTPNQPDMYGVSLFQVRDGDGRHRPSFARYYRHQSHWQPELGTGVRHWGAVIAHLADRVPCGLRMDLGSRIADHRNRNFFN
jgi:hypothetical protein